MNYKEAADYLERTPKFTKKNSPKNTKELLDRIAHPERKMKIIHVAGTNGKGSVCAFLASVLNTAGKRTGLFTSPHLVEVTERFQISGEQVSREEFACAFTKVMQVTQEMIADGFYHPAYFELLFATGLIIFRDAGVEYLVLETGLGGRLDATNLIESPIACIITTIGLDHTEYLGDTLAQIAAEKAGIIKPGVPVIYDARNPESDAVIAAEAKRKGAQMIRYQESMSQILEKTDKKIDFLLDFGYDEKMKVTVPFPAHYQVVNSSLALLALRVIDPGRQISDETAREGILKTRWPGRMETLMPGVILDGAHNADGIRELARTISDLPENEPVALLFSAVQDKDYRGMIRELCETTRLKAVVVTEVGGARFVPAQELLEVFRTYTDAQVVACKEVAEAFKKALELRDNGILFCAGSLYLVGELKSILNQGDTND